MHIEYEVRILNIDKSKIIQKLEELGATFEWESLQKRYTYDFNPKDEKRWIRLRQNGVETTLTIKNVKSFEIDGTEELEINVDSFENTNLILNQLGYFHKAFQENKRRRYHLNGVEIDIDSWPLIPDYIEIEGKNEEEVLNIIEALGYKKEEVTSKDVQSIYLEYGIDLETMKELKLESERK
ncbi:MAG: CYTH domain-containing protein [Bacilli bacterium]|jgi:adenylate cyclase class 2|nr:CYTH domain-containing protein [Bacilli bacterium]